ncbi:hypothetical protein PACTADRAFT_74047 [Pachysolen tannophilus NRRL Y-2460]|uniref:Eukaryotic translation initiation factor 3 subunit K n=1 Tax=Pachysolen tannophilus NRRL Y-2460 TaxID=669874 RepID=A0A1E4U3B5_PACTA|nr:hypothetical protein PACTADRAFT_74047 [Pachysolen tannophilus NRRL Y-2460]
MENTLVSVPPQRPEVVNEILSSLKRYDVLVIKDLQDYLDEQTTRNFQDLNSNLALLKLYELTNPEVDENEREYYSIKVLLKGLINFNYADFQLYLNLLPSYTIINETAPFLNSFNEKVQKLISIYNILVNCKFINFWQIFNSDDFLKQKIILTHYKSLENLKFELQKAISVLISITYNSIDYKFLQASLDFENDKIGFEKFITADLNWEIKNDKVLIKSKDARIAIEEEKIININNENVSFDQISRLIKKAFEN